jgi:SAM-dependent methyltransferase
LERTGNKSADRTATNALHARDWEEMAAVDPLWAILSSPEKRFSQWRTDEFLETGAQDIAQLMQEAERLGLPRQRRTGIDFGCGAGRLTRALSSYFPTSFGVDISSTMIERARELAPNCQFQQSDSLAGFPNQSADLIYSTLVLQHQPSTKAVRSLIKDMVRVLAPGGLLVFQMPMHIPLRNRLQLRRRLYRAGRALGFSHSFLYKRLGLTPIRMLSMSQNSVRSAVVEAGGVVVSIATNKDEVFTHGVYYCTR